MGNPFAIKLVDVEKEQGVKGGQQTQSTSETRAAQEKEQLKNTNVIGATNNGSMATTDGKFENYDGFTFSGAASVKNAEKNGYSQDEVQDKLKQGEDAKAEGKNAEKDSNSARSKAQAASDLALEDTQKVNDQTKQAKTKTAQTTQQVNSNNNKIESKTAENEAIEAEVNDIENEIATLMEEDGQDYSAETFAVNDVPPAPPADNNQQATENGNAQEQNSQESGGLAMPSAENSNGSMQAVQTPFVATSETAVSAQNSAQNNSQNNVQNNAQSKTQQNNATANSKSASGKNSATKAGSSLGAFGSSLVQPKGKNADKIAELQSKSSSLKSTATSNSNTIKTLRTTNTNLFSNTQKYVSQAQTTANTAKANSAAGQKTAQTAQKVGQVTTMVGSAVSATGAVMMAFPLTAPDGVIVSAVGAGVTVSGTTTTSVAQMTNGNTQQGLDTATNAMGQLSTFGNALKQAKAAKVK